MFKKILIANRGEIACRVIETTRRMGIKTVAVYSDADRRARHVRMADEAVHIGGAASADSYLKSDVIIKAAKDTGAEAIHPGYGFLSENAAFAEACEKAAIVFIGPNAEAIRAMGLKDGAKDIMDKAGVPVVPGYQGKKQDAAFLQEEAAKIGYPVLIKAVAGGGGKGMRLVETEKDFPEALGSCKREAKASFDNDHVLIEKYIIRPRHVEVQVFGDNHGDAVYLFERDCSLQRRHQKVVEEAPAPGLREDVRKALGESAVKAAKAICYSGAGTIEFIMDSATQEFFFMEMNTRLQVEHPVTEMITGQDLVEWQLRVAAGGELPLTQDELSINGHAFEVRLYAEDPSNEFLPQTGRIERFLFPVSFRRKPESGRVGQPDPVFQRDDIRVDTGVDQGDEVTIHYDPMIAKIIVHGKNRDDALANMREALSQTGIAGIRTNQEFLSRVFKQEEFIAADVDTGFIPRHMGELVPEDYGRPGRVGLALASVYFLMGLNDILSFRRKPESGEPWQPDPVFQRGDILAFDPWNSRDNWRMGGALVKPLTFVSRGETIELSATCHGGSFDIAYGDESFTASFVRMDSEKLTVAVNGAEYTATIVTHGRDLTIFRDGRVIDLHLYVHGTGDDEKSGEGRILTPMPGKIIDVLVKRGDAVEKDQPLLIMEAMKMEMTIRAGCAGIVEELPVSANDQVADGALLVAIKGEDVA